MNFNTPRAARAFLLAVPVCAVAASAQTQTQEQGQTQGQAQTQRLRSSITSFDRNGNPVIQDITTDPNRSSITSFDRNGNAIITYTSPPVDPNKVGGGTAPDPNPGLYNRFGNSANYGNAQQYLNGYYNPNVNYNYPQYNYGFPAPIYPPAYPVQQQAYVSSWGNGNSIEVIPLSPGYAYPAPYAAPTYPAPYGYPVPAYGYPVPAYGYPAGYPYGYGYGYGQGTYSSNTAGYGFSFGRGGFSASIGGSNTTSRSSTVITVR